VERRVDVEDQFPELRGPAGRLSRGGHEDRVVMDRLEQRGLEPVGHIEDAMTAGAEAARPIGADMDERRHQKRCAGAGDTASGRHEVERTDRLHQPRIRLLLGGNQERPVLGIGDVFEEIDRRMDAADDPPRSLPAHRADRNGVRIDHPPRSAST
jgi:hypothetical protein